MTRQTATSAWFVVAAAAILIRSALELVEPSYYDATTLLDHAAVVSQSLGGLATGVGLLLLWRDPPVARARPFLLLGGLGAISMALGNLLEDTFGVADAVWAFFGGGVVMMLSLLVGGAIALASRVPGRAVGAFLLFAAPGGMLGFGGIMMAVAWLLLAAWLGSRHRAYVVAVAAAVPVAVVISVVLYAPDVLGGS